MIDTSDLLFAIAISLIVYSLTGQNIFWTGIIILIIALLLGMSITYHKKSKLK